MAAFAAAGLLLGAAVLAATGCASRTRTPQPARPVLPSTPAAGMAIGITEFNPNLLWSPAERSSAPAGLQRSRDALDAINPGVYRLPIDWAQVQPDPSRPPNWELPLAGCDRDLAPCWRWNGVRDQLDAIRSRQRRGGLDVLVVLTSPPRWASPAAPAGCELSFTARADRGVAPRALGAYAALARSLLALAAQEGVQLRFWSPWNEPNAPQRISPQRASCSAASPSLAAGRYAQLVRALQAVLSSAPGDHQLVLGEIAAYGAATPRRTGALEFLRDLPSDVVCAADVWAQHLYISPAAVGAQGPALAADGRAGRLDAGASVGLLLQIQAMLGARGCRRQYSLWVTETGVGGPVAGGPRPRDEASARAACRALAAALSAWDGLGFVRAAVQYTFREDPYYPVGLADAQLTKSYPTEELWKAWGQRRPGAPPPPLPASCRD